MAFSFALPIILPVSAMSSKTIAASPRPTLSVIIPARDHARPLRRLLDNLKTHKAPAGWDVEVLVSENDSSDGTQDVIAQSGFRYVASHGKGPGAARNAGVKASKGQLLLFVDADACPAVDDFFQRVVNAASQLRNFGAFGGPILLANTQRRNPIAIGDHWACWFNWSARRPFMQSRIFQPAVCLVVRRDVFAGAGGFLESAIILEDMEFQNRLMASGLPIFFVPGIDVTHEARGSLLRSWRHSWSWGGAFRDRFLTVDKTYGLKYPVGHPRFYRNLRYIFRRRMRLVRYAARQNSRWQAVVGWPFYTATIFAWALAVIWGREPRPGESGPI